MAPRRSLALAAAAAALLACPSVEQHAPADQLVLAAFDPSPANPTIPIPNDLALQAAPALTDGSFQTRLLRSFAAKGGWPADQEVPITIPFRVADRTPSGAYAPAPAPAAELLDLSTVNERTVAVLRTTGADAPAVVPFDAPSYANGVLTLHRAATPDGGRRWDPGARYVVALRGGPNGVKTKDGRTVGADTAISLVVANLPLTNPEFQPPGGIPDANGNGTNQDEIQALEQLRALYGPVYPAIDRVFPHGELASIQTFGTSGTSALTDTAGGELPFPSDFLLTSGDDCKDVRAPGDAAPCVRALQAFGPAAAGLHTLDGFSTTAPLLVPLSGPVQASTIGPETVRLYELGGAPAQLDPTKIVTEPPAFVQGGAATTIALAPAVPVETPQGNLYVPPLDEKSQYLVVVTDGVKDVAGKPLQRSTLMTLVFDTTAFPGPLYDPGGNASAVPGVSPADAKALQAMRDGLGPLLSQLGLADHAVLAYTVTTQSVRDVSKKLSAAPYGIEAAAGQAVFRPSAAAEWPPDQRLGPAFRPELFPNVAKFVEVTFPTVNPIQASTGALDPAFAGWTPQQVAAHQQDLKALVAIPQAASFASAPACVSGSPVRCVPLVVFHHGLGGARQDLVRVADALAAKGVVVAAIDAPLHGERSFCTKDDECDDGGRPGVCTPDPALQTPADAVAPGRCTTGVLKFDPTRLSYAASGNFFVSSNFFRTRDAIRQDLLDQSALVLALAPPPGGAANAFQTALGAQGAAILPTSVYYAGISLGSIVGTSIASTNPRLSRAGLNVGGGTIVDVFTTAPAFQSELVPIFSSLGIDVTKVKPGTPGFDPAQAAKYAQTLSIAKWVLDPADPVNYAAHVTAKDYDPGLQALVTAGLATASTDVYAQLALGDGVVPNPANRLLYELGGFSPYASYRSASIVDGALLHSMLEVNFLPPSDPRYAAQQGGDVERADLASFLASGAKHTGELDIP